LTKDFLMSKKMKISENRKSAINYREKTHFFILSLIFTTLAYSIQTAKFNGSLVSQLCELIAWLYLSISGFCELAVLISYPRFLNLTANKEDILKKSEVEKKIPERAKEALTKIQESLDKLEKYITNFSLIHLWFGILGFVSLMIARGYDPFINIFW